MSLLKFDPATGNEKPYPSHPEQYRKFHGQVAWVFNPFTGERRDARDIGSDTFGLMIEAPAANDAGVAPATLEWSHTLLDGETVTYEAAEKAVAELGDGWRLPTRQELESILDLSRHDPAIDTDKFPDTKSNWYWTSTPCAWRASAVWVVGFGGGYIHDHGRRGVACVRAVRSGQ